MKTRYPVIIILFLIFVVFSGCVDKDNSKIEQLEKEVQELKQQIKDMEKERVTPLPISSKTGSENSTNETQINVPLETNGIKDDTSRNPSLVPEFTPQVQLKKFPQNSIFVTGRMEEPIDFGNGKYELETVKIKIINQQNNKLSLKAQIRSGEQVLEEKSIFLENDGSSIEYFNDQKHFIYNTNVTLRLFIQGYEPINYEVSTAAFLN